MNIKLISLKSVSVMLVIFFLILPTYVNALTPVNPIGIHLTNPFNCSGGSCTLLGLINAILNNIIMPVAAVAVTVWIVWAGFSFLRAQGNKEEITKAKERLLWSLIGAGILLGAAGIARVLESTVRAITTV